MNLVASSALFTTGGGDARRQFKIVRHTDAKLLGQTGILLAVHAGSIIAGTLHVTAFMFLLELFDGTIVEIQASDTAAVRSTRS